MSVLRRCPLAVGLYIVFTSWLYAVRRSHSWGTDEWTVCNILNHRESNWASLPGRPRVKKQNQYVFLSLELTLRERKRGLEGGGEGKGMGGRARSFASLTPSKWRCQGHLRRGSNYTNYIVRHRGIKHWLIVSSVGVVAVLTPALTAKTSFPRERYLSLLTPDLLPEGTILVSGRTRDILPECTTPQSLLAAKTSLPRAMSLLEAKLVLQSRSRNLMYAAIWFVRSTTHKTKTKNRKSVRIRLGAELAFFFACPWTRISRVKMDLTEWRVSSAKMSMANCYRCAPVNSVSSYG